MDKTREIRECNEGKLALIVEDALSMCRDLLHELGGEFNLTDNPYSFTTAWLEDDQVWWDKDSDHPMVMSEATEVLALYETILKTLDEIEAEE